MKKKFTILVLLAVFGLSGFSQNQLFNDSIVIPSNGRSFNECYATDDYVFVSDATNDSIYVINIASESIISSVAAANDIGARITYINGKILCHIDQYSFDIYDASNPLNITHQELLNGLTRGILTYAPKDEINYTYWLEHWNSSMTLIDVSGSSAILRGNISTGGNAQGVSRIGNKIYVGNAYQNSKVIDISDPDNLSASAFGSPAVNVKCSDKYVVMDNYFNGNVVSILDTLENVLDTKSPAFLKLLTRDNHLFTEVNGNYNLYDISSGTFDSIATAPLAINDYNNTYWISCQSDRIILFPRVPCSDTILNDTIIHYVSDIEFQIESPKTYFESTDSLTTQVGGCDSIIHNYSKYIFDANHCTDTTEVFDTTYVTVYDSISVTDTLIINVVLTGITPPNNVNTVAVYPNPANDYVIINTGDYSQMTDYNLQIVNTFGQTVFENLINQAEFQINVNDFGGYGTYFIKIFDDQGTLLDTRKLILQ